jgi:hypothetical protein
MTTETLPAVRQNGQAMVTEAIPEGPALTPETLEKVMLDGDLSGLTTRGRIEWYYARCQAAGLDPRSQPFQYLKLNGKLVLYATKSATENLVGIHKLRVEMLDQRVDSDLGICTAKCRVTFPDGRFAENIGAVAVQGLKGDALANALMKTITKAQRRTVLAACGLGMLDESELETVPGAQVVEADYSPPTPPQHNTGYGSGQYAHPADVDAYVNARDAWIKSVNDRWGDHWMVRTKGEVPAGLKDLLNSWQVDGHLLKWAVEEGRLDSSIVPEDAKSRQKAPWVAIVFVNDRAALSAEMNRYLDEQWARAREALYRKHPELREAEDTTEDNEQRAGTLDPVDVGDTEGGRGG